MFNQNSPYQSIFGQGQMMANSSPISNKILVASKEDAISRGAPLNSVTLYVNQMNGHLYEVAIDFSGNKICREFETIEVQDIPKENELENRLKSLEEKLNLLIGDKNDVTSGN